MPVAILAPYVHAWLMHQLFGVPAEQDLGCIEARC